MVISDTILCTFNQIFVYYTELGLDIYGEFRKFGLNLKKKYYNLKNACGHDLNRPNGVDFIFNMLINHHQMVKSILFPYWKCITFK